MAFTLSTAFQNALDDPERYAAVLLTCTFGINVYGFWTGLGTITYNSVQYVNAGSIIELDEVDQADDGSVTEFHIKCSTSPDKGLTTDILTSFYDENWQFGKVVLQLVMQDPDTGDIIGALTLARGSIFEAPFIEGPSGTYIDARVMSNSIKMSESGGNYRNDATQKGFDGSDTSLVEIGTLGGAITKDLKWGQG